MKHKSDSRLTIFTTNAINAPSSTTELIGEYVDTDDYCDFHIAIKKDSTHYHIKDFKYEASEVWILIISDGWEIRDHDGPLKFFLREWFRCGDEINIYLHVSGDGTDKHMDVFNKLLEKVDCNWSIDTDKHTSEGAQGIFLNRIANAVLNKSDDPILSINSNLDELYEKRVKKTHKVEIWKRISILKTQIEFSLVRLSEDHLKNLANECEDLGIPLFTSADKFEQDRMTFWKQHMMQKETPAK